MAEYERTRTIYVPEDDVWAFVSDVGNMPAFVPTVTAAELRPDGTVHVRGQIGNRMYEDVGRFNVEPARRRTEWGVDEREYSGWLTVSGSDGRSQVVAHLSVPPFVDPSGRPITGELPEDPDQIAEGLEAALDSLRNILEGRDGKAEPQA
jgi:carbon monoxide dehydrogenase subunit G